MQETQVNPFISLNNNVKWPSQSPVATRITGHNGEMIAPNDHPFSLEEDVGFRHRIWLADLRYSIRSWLHMQAEPPYARCPMMLINVPWASPRTLQQQKGLIVEPVSKVTSPSSSRKRPEGNGTRTRKPHLPMKENKIGIAICGFNCGGAHSTDVSWQNHCTKPLKHLVS